MGWTAPHKASKCRRVIVDDGRDRNLSRLAVGKGFPFPLFRLRNGFTVLPWRTFAYEPGSSCASGKNIFFPAGRVLLDHTGLEHEIGELHEALRRDGEVDVRPLTAPTCADVPPVLWTGSSGVRNR